MNDERNWNMSQPASDAHPGMNDAVIESLRRELRITRIFNGILSVLLICLLLGGALVVTKVQGYMEQSRPLVEKLTEVDYEALNETMNSLNATLNEIDWEQLSVQLAELDMDALNDAIAGLDTEALSKSLNNLNEVVETLENFSDSLKSFFSKFGLSSAEQGGL